MKNVDLFKAVEYDEATPEVREIYDETMREFQIPFVLNWFKCQGGNGTLLRGNWEKLRSTLIRGKVPNVLKQMIIYNVSKKRGCDYCSQVHGILTDSMGSEFVSDEDFKLTENLESEHIPHSYRVALEVVTKAALHPAQLSSDDLTRLQDAGFDREDSIELLAQADLVNMLNTIADVAGIRIDNELAVAA